VQSDQLQVVGNIEKLSRTSVLWYDFPEELDCGKDKRILLVLDQAIRHTAKEFEVLASIHLEVLPVRSPELLPTERL